MTDSNLIFQEKTLRSVRSALTDLIEISAGQTLNEIDVTVLKDTVNALDDPFLIVVVGEFNSGKSTLINALLGREVTPEGITPTTAMVHLIRFGETFQKKPLAQWGELITVPNDILRAMSIVDTPGTNSVFTDHEILTKDFYPRSDFVLFVTSADRPYSESERLFLDSIRNWGKKIVILINKIDLIPTKTERDQLVSFVRTNVHHDFRFAVPVFPVSARLAKRALEAEGTERAALAEESGFPAVADFLNETLSDAERFRLKMDSAIASGLKIGKALEARAASELKIFRDDLAVVESVEAMANGFERDFEKDIARTIREIRLIFDEIRRSADEYFADLFRIRNLPKILRKEKIQNEFQDRVLKKLPVEIERLTTETVGEIYRRQSGVTAHIAERITERGETAPAVSGTSAALSERSSVLARLRAAIDELSDQLDRDVAVEIGMKHVQTAVKTALAIEVSAVGVGAALTIAATTLATDILGILAALWVAVAGFAVLPYYRNKSQNEFRRKLAAVEDSLTQSLTNSLREEVSGVTRRMTSVVQPLRAFNQASIAQKTAETDRLQSLLRSLADLQASFF